MKLLPISVILSLAVPLIFTTQVRAEEIRATFTGTVEAINGSSFVLRIGNGNVMVDAKSDLLKDGTLSNGAVVTVSGPYRGAVLTPYTITRLGDGTPFYADSSKAPGTAGVTGSTVK